MRVLSLAGRRDGNSFQNWAREPLFRPRGQEEIRGMQLVKINPSSFSNYTGGGEEVEESLTVKTEKAPKPGSSILYAILYFVAPILTLLVVAGSLVALGYFPSKDPSYTNQFLVLTGQRTRDLRSLNSYSMQMVLGDDPKTRLYLCMMQAGIGLGAQDCPKSTSVVGFRDCLKSIKKDCEASSDGGFPRDGGFLQCIGNTIKTTPTMINKFVQCEDLAESIMVDSVQTPYSTLFLGSYNYASLLISSMAILASFLVFTVGGFYDGGRIQTSVTFHINNYYFPMALIPTCVAMVWSWIFLIIAYAYSFPIECDNAICITKANAYPTTPWTGILCFGVFLGLSAYYGSFVFERFFEKENKVMQAPNESVVFDPATKGINVFSNNQRGFNQDGSDVEYPQETDSWNSGAVPTGVNSWNSGAVPAVNTWSPSRTTSWSPQTYAGLKFGRTARYHRLGVKLHSGTSAAIGKEEEELFPLMAETFAWALIFVDGILFLGMINPQHSPMHENVVTMFASITACRILQLAVAKFMDEAFVARIDKDVVGWKPTLDPKQFGIQVTLILTYLASLGLLLIALYNFMNASGMLWTFNNQSNSPTWVVSFFFLLAVGILPEVVRIAQFIYFCVRDVPASTILLYTEFLFAWNWVFRVVLIIVALFMVPAHLKEQSDAVMNFIR